MRLDFLRELIWRRVSERYIGTTSRLAWVILAPILPMLFSVLVFYYIARLPQVQELGLARYTAFVFTGLLPFRILQRASQEGCEILSANMEMLKTTVFPLPYLSLAAVGSLFVEFLIQSVVMIALLVVAGTPVSWTILLVPAAVILLFAAAIGASWLMSIAGYGMRELGEVLGVAFAGLIYITPVMYPITALPSALQKLIWLNPITAYIQIFRDSLMPSADGFHLSAWYTAFGCSLLLIVVGGYAIRWAQNFVGDMV